MAEKTGILKDQNVCGDGDVSHQDNSPPEAVRACKRPNNKDWRGGGGSAARHRLMTFYRHIHSECASVLQLLACRELWPAVLEKEGLKEGSKEGKCSEM